MRFFYTLTLILILITSGFAKKKGAPPMASGAPEDRTCLSSKCHAGEGPNASDAQIFIEGLPQVFTPNEIYTITLHLEEAKAKAWGFQATVADSAGSAIGTLSPLDETFTQMLSNEKYKSRTNREYVTHTEKGTSGPKRGISPTWQINWKAPAEATHPALFYFAFNAANGNKKKTGDNIYTRSIEVQPKQD